MKRKPSTNAAAALVLLAGLHFGQGSAGADSITVPLVSGGGNFQQAGDGKGKIKCPGFGFTVEAGKPMMPMRVVPIAVPPDAENIEVRFDGPCEPVPGQFEIVPAGMVVPAGAATAAELANPADCRSCLAIVEVRWNTDSSLSLFWRCVAQMVYRIEYCNDPGGGNVWRTAQNAIVTPATGMFEWKDNGTLTGGPPRLSPRRFYRVVPHGPGYP